MPVCVEREEVKVNSKQSTEPRCMLANHAALFSPEVCHPLTPLFIHSYHHHHHSHHMPYYHAMPCDPSPLPINLPLLLPTRSSLCPLLRGLSRLLIKRLAIILILLARTRLDRIIRNWLNQQLLRRSQDRHDLRAWFPSLGLENADAHAAVLVVGDVGVEDAGLEVDLWGLEGVFVWKGQEELEFAALW